MPAYVKSKPPSVGGGQLIRLGDLPFLLRVVSMRKMRTSGGCVLALAVALGHDESRAAWLARWMTESIALPKDVWDTYRTASLAGIYPVMYF